MGREVRKVPATWEHPKTTLGHYIPLENYSKKEIEELVNNGDLDKDAPFYGYKAMPLWADEECTHFQMYENVSEGTPISPPMQTEELLAKWLESNNANAGGGMTATKEQWLRMINVGFAPTMVVKNGVFQPGVRL